MPEGDVLVHSGDLTYRGTVTEISNELFKLARLSEKFRYTLLISGNHDWLGEYNPSLMAQLCKDNGITYLDDSGICIDGVNFYGSPYQPEFCEWAFNLPRGEKLKQKWALIPDDTHVLITHGPPAGILDKTPYGEAVGCEDLYRRTKELTNLKLHVFGHIHDGYGQLILGETTFVNASTCTEQYKPTNKPIVVTI